MHITEFINQLKNAKTDGEIHVLVTGLRGGMVKDNTPELIDALETAWDYLASAKHEAQDLYKKYPLARYKETIDDYENVLRVMVDNGLIEKD